MSDFTIEHEVREHVIVFRIRYPWNGEQEVVFSGTIKWDGCSNWETPKECMLHICGPDMMLDFSKVLMKCYLIAGEHFPEIMEEINDTNK